MITIKTIEDLINKHTSLEKELSSESVDKKKFAEKSKEYADLNEIINIAKKYLSYEVNKSEIEKILDDKSSDEELKKMAETELNDLNSEKEKNEKTKIIFITKDEADKKDAIIEIRAEQVAEASLFASDLFKMYEKVSHKNGQ